MQHCIPLRRQYPVVVHALERLQNQGDDKVSCIHHAASVYHSFGSSEHILHSTVYLSTFLQDNECDRAS